uniref:Uncharacterized protein n=1 Tax=viral metagenome TaxID=1070528 RepID=A0A6C0C5E9_9ZZZZ
MRNVRFFGNYQPDNEDTPKKFSLHRMNFLPFVANAGVSSACLVAAYYNTKSIPYISGFFLAISSSSGKIVPSLLVAPAAIGLGQIALTAVLLYGTKSFFMNAYDICYKQK